MKITALLLAVFLAAPYGVAQDVPAQPVADQDVISDQDVAAADLVTTLDAAGNFSILLGALRSTGLDAALSGTETFTVFAPTDEAFQKLPAGTLDGLSVDELASVLRYHVLVGAVTSADAAALTSAPTVEGTDLAISSGDAGLMVGEANVVEADIEASNGVIHVIDTVLLPTDASIEGKAAGGQAADDDMDDMEEDDTEYEESDADADTEEGDENQNVSEASPETADDDQR